MPYISQELRKGLDTAIEELTNAIDEGRYFGQAGLVNYVIARLVSQLIQRHGRNYRVLNEFIGALECCKLELYRRLVAPHEEKKIKENGDVFNVS